MSGQRQRSAAYNGAADGRSHLAVASEPFSFFLSSLILPLPPSPPVSLLQAAALTKHPKGLLESLRACDLLLSFKYWGGACPLPRDAASAFRWHRSHNHRPSPLHHRYFFGRAMSSSSAAFPPPSRFQVEKEDANNHPTGEYEVVYAYRAQHSHHRVPWYGTDSRESHYLISPVPQQRRHPLLHAGQRGRGARPGRPHDLEVRRRRRALWRRQGR